MHTMHTQEKSSQTANAIAAIAATASTAKNVGDGVSTSGHVHSAAGVAKGGVAS